MPGSYRERMQPRAAVYDIRKIAGLTPQSPLGLALYWPLGLSVVGIWLAVFGAFRISSLSSLLAFGAAAQNPDDPGGGVDDVPVDGGIILLLAAGAGYGLKQLRKNNSAYTNSSGDEA